MTKMTEYPGREPSQASKKIEKFRHEILNFMKKVYEIKLFLKI